MQTNDFADLESGRTEQCPVPAVSLDRLSFQLTVTEGSDRGLSITIRESDASAVLIGQSPACSFRLNDPQVSRRHVEAEIVGNRLRITDLDSTNGTLISGVAIREAYLKGGELIELGTTAIQVVRATETIPNEQHHKANFGSVVGASRAMQRLYGLLERLAQADVPLVIEGETGTGKEVLAEAIHERGKRASQPFVVFDCTTVPSNLMESELFGHERGSFTGAVSARRGCFEQAHGGTLLIDEIGELDLSLQPKLLRAIERNEIRRVGSEKFIRVDVRVIAATRRNLDLMVQENRFRDDLFYRLAVGRIELPPLRRRTGDIAILARHFWKELGGDVRQLPAQVMRSWEENPWPGNIRQLRNAVARQLALGDLAQTKPCQDSEDEVLINQTWDSEKDKVDRLPAQTGEGVGDDFLNQIIAKRLPLPIARLHVVKEFEQRYITAVLEEHGGNVMEAAKASGVARRYFQILRKGDRRKKADPL